MSGNTEQPQAEIPNAQPAMITSPEGVRNLIEKLNQTVTQNAAVLNALGQQITALDRAIAIHTHDNQGRACQPFVAPKV